MSKEEKNYFFCVKKMGLNFMGQAAHLAKCPGASCSWGEFSMGHVVHRANCLGASCPWRKMSWGKMSMGRVLMGYVVRENTSYKCAIVVLDTKSQNIPEVGFVRRWAVGVLGIWREGVSI